MKVKSESVQKVHDKKKLSSNKGAQGGIACHSCGNLGPATTYRFKDKVCHKCKKRGHLAKVCGSMGACHHPPRNLGPRDPLHNKLVRSHNMFTLGWTRCAWHWCFCGNHYLIANLYSYLWWEQIAYLFRQRNPYLWPKYMKGRQQRKYDRVKRSQLANVRP